MYCDTKNCPLFTVLYNTFVEDALDFDDVEAAFNFCDYFSGGFRPSKEILQKLLLAGFDHQKNYKNILFIRQFPESIYLHHDLCHDSEQTEVDDLSTVIKKAHYDLMSKNLADPHAAFHSSVYKMMCHKDFKVRNLTFIIDKIIALTLDMNQSPTDKTCSDYDLLNYSLSLAVTASRSKVG